MSWVAADPRVPEKRVFGKRLDRSGNFIDSQPFFLGNPSAPTLLNNGTNFLFAWLKNVPRFLNTVVSGTIGSLTDTNAPLSQRDLTAEATNRTELAGASNDKNFLLVWAESNRIAGQIVSVDESGMIPGDQFVVAATTEVLRVPSASPLGTNYLVVWKSSPDGILPGRKIYGQLVTDAGRVQGAISGFPIYQDADAVSLPKITSNGEQALIFWASGTQILGIRVNSAGQVMDPQPRVLASGSTSIGNVSAVWADGMYFMTWNDSGTGVRVTKILPDGTALYPNGFLVSSTLKPHLFLFGPPSPTITRVGQNGILLAAEREVFPVPRVAAFLLPTRDRVMDLNLLTAGQLQLSWTGGEPEKDYQIQFSPVIFPAQWSNWDNQIHSTNGIVEATIDPTQLSRSGFFRVVEVTR